MRPHQCQQCGREFIAARAEAAYCSIKCRVAAHRARKKPPATENAETARLRNENARLRAEIAAHPAATAAATESEKIERLKAEIERLKAAQSQAASPARRQAPDKADAKGGSPEKLNLLFLRAVRSGSDNETLVAVRKFNAELTNCALDPHDIDFAKMVEAGKIKMAKAAKDAYWQKWHAERDAEHRETVKRHREKEAAFAALPRNAAILDELRRLGETGATAAELAQTLSLQNKDCDGVSAKQYAAALGKLRTSGRVIVAADKRDGEKVYVAKPLQQRQGQ